MPTRHERGLAGLSWLGVGLLLVPLLVACGSADDTDDAAATATTPAAVSTTTTGQPAAQAATATVPPPRPTPTRAAPTPTRTPRPNVTPTPIPPPLPAIGDVVQTDGWTLTVTGYDLYNRVGAHTAAGIFLYLRLTVVNTADQPTAFPFDGLVVVDERGASYFPHGAATNETLVYDLGIQPDQQLAPDAATNVAIVFDIPVDATGLVLTTPARVFQIRVEYADQPK